MNLRQSINCLPIGKGEWCGKGGWCGGHGKATKNSWHIETKWNSEILNVTFMKETMDLTQGTKQMVRKRENLPLAGLQAKGQTNALGNSRLTGWHSAKIEFKTRNLHTMQESDIGRSDPCISYLTHRCHGGPYNQISQPGREDPVVLYL